MTNTEYINHILQSLPSLLWGKWELKDLISASPDSAIFGLESKRMNRTETAVLKIVPLTASKAYFTDEQKQAQIAKAKEQAELESDLLFRLQSCPNIVTYQDEDMQEIQVDGQFEGYAYLVRMEALERIADCIRAQRFQCSEENVIRLAKELTYALQFAHSQGITHRNIQPDKIYLSAAGTAKLGGFHPPKRSGAIRAFSDSDAYIAPEIFTSKRAAEYTPQADIYSLGICLYQLMNGMNLPFESECDADEAWEKRMNGDPFPIPADASDAFAAIILKACAFSPADRYQSAEELLEALMFPAKAAAQKEPLAALEPDEVTAASADESEPTEVPVAAAAPTVQPTEEPVADAKPAEEEIADVPPAETPKSVVEELPPTEAVPPQPAAEPEKIAESALSQPEIRADDTQRVPVVQDVTASLTEETDASAFVIQGGTLIRYRGTAQKLTIPTGVSVIGTTAFENCSTVREITLPEGVMRIEEMAFANCAYLEKVAFPNSLRMVNNKAFLNCIALQSAEFHGVLSQIGTSTFDGCQSLETVVFDCPIEKIGYDAFSGCASLKEFRVSEYSYSYKTINGVLFDFEGKYLVRYPAGRSNPDYIVPETVFTIEDGAFYGSGSLERIKLTRNVKKIGSAAFRDCVRLREIVFSENLETIKTAAFQGCISLTKINLPAWTTYIGTYAFSHCEQLASVNLPGKMTELCMGVFEYCKSLSDIRLPESIIKIGEKAFMESGLTEMFIPYSTTKIETQSFANCTKLRFIFLSNRINRISPDAFDGCNSALTVYGMVNSMAAEFANRKGFKFEPMFSLTAGAGEYELRGYKGCFAHVVIPPDVNLICENAFYSCKSMRSVEIPSNVGAIEKHAFDFCENLESVTMTNLIMRIGEDAFAHCPALKQFNIIDMSQSFAPKVQRKIHRNFYKVLQAIHPESAEQYAAQYNVTAKSTFLDVPFPWQIKKESQEHIERLADGYEGSPIANALIQLVQEEMQKSERRLSQIELFRDCIIITGVKAGQIAHRKSLYNDLGIGIRTLPDVNHLLACATVIVRAIGPDYQLSPVQNKDSALIRPSI